MKKATLAIAAAGAVVLGVAAIHAVSATEGARGHRGGHSEGRFGHGGAHGSHHAGMGRHFAVFFDMLDVDADNVVTREEALRPIVQRFARIDTDGNGIASAVEIDAARAADRSRFDERMLERLDVDLDGQVSAAEFAVLGRAVFARADADDDGTVSYREFAGLRPAMGRHDGRGPGTAPDVKMLEDDGSAAGTEPGESTSDDDR
jgi:hypothetical protein